MYKYRRTAFTVCAKGEDSAARSLGRGGDRVGGRQRCAPPPSPSSFGGQSWKIDIQRAVQTVDVCSTGVIKIYRRRQRIKSRSNFHYYSNMKKTRPSTLRTKGKKMKTESFEIRKQHYSLQVSVSYVPTNDCQITKG